MEEKWRMCPENPRLAMAVRTRRMAHMILRTLCLAILLSIPSRADNTALDAWLKRQAGIESMQCTFTQERKLPSLKQPVSTPGRLSFARPGKLRWELGDPPATLVVSDGETITLIDMAAKTARRVAADSPQAARFGMLNGEGFRSAEKFHAMFDVAGHRVVSGIHQYTLRSKDARARKQMPWLFLDIDPSNHLLRAMEIELKDKSRIRTIFHDPKLNPQLDPALFTANTEGLNVK
jgi:outer membrane lipoprotein-sorting protein